MVSVNQVKHFFVAKSTDGEALDNIQVVETAINGSPAVMLKYEGQGGDIKSDYIELDKVIYAKAKKAKDFDKELKQAVLTLNASVNGGAPAAGEDYIIDVHVKNYIGLGDNNTLTKFAAAHAYLGMQQSDLYKVLAKSLAKNFKRDEEVNKLFEIGVQTSGGFVPASAIASDTAATGVVIKEASQVANWVRGEFPVQTVNFDVFPKAIVVNGDEVIPFTVEESGAVAKTSTGEKITNAQDIADVEYFCAGERGDQYRQVGYPRTIRTKYMLDDAALSENGYDVLDIAFYFVGRGISSQKSEKHILIVGEGSGENSLGDAISLVKSDLASAGITIAE